MMSVRLGQIRFIHVALLLLGVLVLLGVCDAALAQGNPFGGPRPAPRPETSGLVGWILAKQAEFYRQLAGLVRAAKADGSAVWGLFALSFAYGVFHAAGPGHGKAVISSYVVANEETWRRGVILSFASALLQAVVAVLLVGVLAALLGATARAMSETVRVVEIVGYSLVALIGARLLWVKGRALWNTWREVRAQPAPLGAAATHAHHHEHHHDHAHHDHAHDHHDHHDHTHTHEDVLPWGHAHGPEPEELAGPGGWKRGLSAIVAVGLRPCSGAILVLVFALAQGIFWAGIGATFVMGIGTAITVAAIATFTVGAKALAAKFAHARTGYGMLIMRGIETGAAVLVLVFGLALLAGYMASERMMGM